ncbi:Mitochondrial import inner membrane translocase subunit TIM8 [Smittium culicis]|uniref:Mitochondrial import inner membrane translocase subunit n=1 Tax=Smittium culicis TaxID=133412 RepID=A0A1R1Y2Y4_9FUNG|nr:Mitochondrial import inner membrane translocase subunit TIM8 [Smittium culicis]
MEFASFDQKTQQDLQKFVEAEQAKAEMQTTIHSFTSRCWEKCITSTKSTGLDKNESTCMENCVNRFIDSSVYIVKNLQNRR